MSGVRAPVSAGAGARTGRVELNDRYLPPGRGSIVALLANFGIFEAAGYALPITLMDADTQPTPADSTANMGAFSYSTNR